MRCDAHAPMLVVCYMVSARSHLCGRSGFGAVFRNSGGGGAVSESCVVVRLCDAATTNHAMDTHTHIASHLWHASLAQLQGALGEGLMDACRRGVAFTVSISCWNRRTVLR